MIEISLETKRLESLIKAVSVNKQIEKPVMTFKEKGVIALNVDKGRALLNYSLFQPKYFVEYKIDSVTELCVNAESILDMLRKIGGDQIKLTYTIEDNIVKLNTNTESATIPALVPEPPMKELPHFLKYDGDILTIDETFQLTQKIPIITKEMGNIKGLVGQFIVENNSLHVYYEEDDGTSFKQKIADVNSVDFSVLFTKEFLVEAFSSMVTSEVLIKLSKDTMMCIEDKTSDYSIITLIAPRMQS